MAEPPILTLADLSLSFGGDPLLVNVGIAVQPGDRIALVGRNGSGKSTLMKLMAGLVEPDTGSRFARPGVRVGYMPQDPDLAGFDTVGGFAADGLDPAERWRAEMAMEALKLDPALASSSASGGERRRAALAKILAEAPDLLLLDEPTNHLDIAAIAWLEAELASSRAAFVAVSHDRAFLRNLTDRLLWVDRGQVRALDRGFAAFEEWQDATYGEEDAARHKLGRLIEAEGRWAVEGISARRRRNQGRVRRLAALRAERRAAIARAGRGAAWRSRRPRPRAGWWSRPRGSTQELGGRTLFRDFSIRVGRGDRVAIVGPNGVGKTTLLNVLTGRPRRDERPVRLGANLVPAVLRPGPRGARPREDALGDADRRRARRQRPGDGARAAPARGRLPEGVPFRRGASARPGLGALRRRARPAAAGEADGARVEPPGAGRADQRS